MSENEVFLEGAKRTFQETPGPGTYESCAAIPKMGKQFWTKYRSCSATVINPRTKRFANQTMTNPGPSTYQTTE